MTSDGRLPAAERRNYKHVGDALVRMVREEGILTLWRGAVPTMARAMVVNAAQLASYSQAKQSLMATGKCCTLFVVLLHILIALLQDTLVKTLLFTFGPR